MTVTCPECFTPARVPGAAAGKRVRCKRCGEAFRAAAEPAAPPPKTRRPSPRAGRPSAPRRTRRAAGPSPATVGKWAGAAVAAVAALAAAAWLIPKAPDVAAAVRGLDLPDVTPPGVPAGPPEPGRERRATSERWVAGEGGTPSGANAELRDRGGPDFDIGPNAPPPKDAKKEREAAERSVARLEAVARGERLSTGTMTVTRDGVARTFAVGPSAGGAGGFGGPGVTQVPAQPAVGVRVRRRRWEGYAALGGIELLTDRRAADDVLPGESAEAAPDGYVFGGLDAAVGYYVYAVRPLWVPAGGPPDGSGEVREGTWLGEKGAWPVGRLRPDGRRLAGLTARRGGLLDSVALLLTGGSSAPEDPAPGEAASVYRSGGR